MRGISLIALLTVAGSAAAAPSAVIVHEKDVMAKEPTPHGNIGLSTAYRISDKAPDRTMEFRKRVLHVGAAVGAHPISHDEVYYVTEGEGELTSGGKTSRLKAGDAAYLYEGDTVGIKQIGDKPLTIIISYPLKTRCGPAKAP